MNKNNNWILVSCLSPPENEEMCSYLFFEFGALGLETENLDHKNICLKASFDPTSMTIENLGGLRRAFEKANLSSIAKTLKLKTMPNEDWLTNWKKHFEPFTVGESFIICPPWQINKIAAEKIGKRKKIIIDPGMAFGTGLHATTKYCLHAIERFGKGNKILDVGTGSGILAIAYSTLSPTSHIVALEIDPTAIENAQHNIELNKIKQISLMNASPETLVKSKDTFDTILSNLTVDDIIKLLPVYKKLLADNGVLILAGIIEERLNLLKTALANAKFKILEEEHDKGWVGLTVSKS